MTKTELLAALEPLVTTSDSFAIEAKGVEGSYLILNPLDAFRAIRLSFSEGLNYDISPGASITFIRVV